MISVVGGVYAERCVEPFWNDVFGSGGRAAAAISASLPEARLHTYKAEGLTEGIDNLATVFGIEVVGPIVPGPGVGFDYVHSLSDPRISPRPDAIPEHPPLEVDDQVVLRFGMLEGTAKVRGGRVVYDPQSAFDPRPFAENGSSAERLALILNRFEGFRLTGETDPARIVAALSGQGADVTVLKLGGHGALVAEAERQTRVPAYRSGTVWKVGSGDVFSAAFALHWGVNGMPAAEAAELASRSVSSYAGTRSLPLPPASDLMAAGLVPVTPGRGRVYIAAPFFNLAELWMVEEIRRRLLDMDVEVFSPLHDVGRGPAHEVTAKDLEGVDGSDVILAVLNGGDAGTIFEVGYAVARGKRVVALAQNVRPEDLKMPAGSGCLVVEDLVSAIYHAVWALG